MMIWILHIKTNIKNTIYINKIYQKLFVVAGGRSRLHLLDFGSPDRGKGSSKFTLSALGNVILAIFNGQKHLPYK